MARTVRLTTAELYRQEHLLASQAEAAANTGHPDDEYTLKERRLKAMRAEREANRSKVAGLVEQRRQQREDSRSEQELSQAKRAAQAKAQKASVGKAAEERRAREEREVEEKRKRVAEAKKRKEKGMRTVREKVKERSKNYSLNHRIEKAELDKVAQRIQSEDYNRKVSIIQERRTESQRLQAERLERLEYWKSLRESMKVDASLAVDDGAEGNGGGESSEPRQLETTAELRTSQSCFSPPKTLERSLRLNASGDSSSSVGGSGGNGGFSTPPRASSPQRRRNSPNRRVFSAPPASTRPSSRLYPYANESPLLRGGSGTGSGGGSGGGGGGSGSSRRKSSRPPFKSHADRNKLLPQKLPKRNPQSGWLERGRPT